MLDKNKVREVILTVGIPASGKSTWAHHYAMDNNGIVIERDEIREQLFNCSRSDYKYTKAREKQITDEQDKRIKAALFCGTPVIISDTNLRESTRQRIKEVVGDFCKELDVKYKISHVTFEVPLKEAMEFNRKRLHTVPEAVMIRMEKRMREYLGKYTHDHSNPQKLPECILVDIDGTVADMAGKRSPFEWDKVGGDLPKSHIINIVREMQLQYEKYNLLFPEVIFMSGRDSICRGETEDWLSTHTYFDRFNKVDKLFMRPVNDNRPDTVIKEELFDLHIKDYYHVTMVIDDRKCMVQHWQSMGFNVLDVGNGISDF